MGMPIFMGGEHQESNPYPDFYITDTDQIYRLVDLLEGKKDKDLVSLIGTAFGPDSNAYLRKDPETGGLVPASVEKMVQDGGGLSDILSAYIAKLTAAGCDAFKEAKESGKEAGRKYLSNLDKKYSLDAYKPEALDIEKIKEDLKGLKFNYVINKT